MSSRRIAIQAPRRPVEHRHTFACFGGTCTVIVADSRRPAYAAEWSAVAKRSLLSWHGRFSRFEPASELALFNADPRTEIPVSRMLRQLIEAALSAARETGGLVDATLGAEMARAGYGSHFDGAGIGLREALCLAPPRSPAGPSAKGGWRRMRLDPIESVVHRTPGTIVDPGGIAKGVFADQLAGALGSFDEFAVDCAGDVRLGGRAAAERVVHVSSPFDGSILHTFAMTRRWQRDERDRAAQLARRRGPAGPPSARPANRQSRVHRHRPGDGSGPDCHRGRGTRQGRAAQRSRPRARLACARRPVRARRRQLRGGRARRRRDGTAGRARARRGPLGEP